MNPRVLFAIQVAVYAAFPVAFSLMRSKARYTYFYIYIAVLHLIGGLFGSFYSYPLTDGIAVSAGSVAYGAVLMSTLVLVIVGRDLEVVRNIIRLIIVINLVKLPLFAISAEALKSPRFVNPFGTHSDVFDVSLRVIAVGGALVVAELVLLVAIFEAVKRAVADTNVLAALYVVFFVAVLCLDGVLFPTLAFTFESGLASTIQNGVHAKLILAASFGVPLVLFLVISRAVIATYAATPLRVQEILFAPRHELVGEIERQNEEIAAKNREIADNVELRDLRRSVSTSLADVDVHAEIESVLDDVGTALGRLPGLDGWSPCLVVIVDGSEVGRHGRRADTILRSRSDLRGGVREPWFEMRTLGGALCVPLSNGTELTGVLELDADAPPDDALIRMLTSISFELSAMFRDALAADREMWSARASIMSVLGDRDVRAVFQPIVSLTTGAVVAFEALSRFEGGFRPEERFREASRLGLGRELEQLALETILEQATHFDPSVPISVNLSPASVFVPAIKDLIVGAGRSLTLEITEHDRVESYESLIDEIRSYPDIRLSVDDAGSGYASLRHIFRLRPDYVKLDRQWVRDIDADRPRQVLVRGLLSFVKELGGTLVAEGIERVEEADVLRSLGVPYAQGFWFAAPAPATTFPRALT